VECDMQTAAYRTYLDIVDIDQIGRRPGLL
jgi:hypothetical protein